MARRKIDIISCDRCIAEQSSEEPLLPNERLLGSITQINIHIPFLPTPKANPEFPYDYDVEKDLCPSCRSVLKIVIERFFRNASGD